MLLIIKNKAIWKHIAGFDSTDASAKLHFVNRKHAEYFIAHFNGQHDYKEAMPQERVEFSVFLKTPNGEFEDKMVKPENWKPFI